MDHHKPGRSSRPLAARDPEGERRFVPRTFITRAETAARWEAAMSVPRSDAALRDLARDASTRNTAHIIASHLLGLRAFRIAPDERRRAVASFERRLFNAMQAQGPIPEDMVDRELGRVLRPIQHRRPKHVCRRPRARARRVARRRTARSTRAGPSDSDPDPGEPASRTGAQSSGTGRTRIAGVAA